MFNILFIILTCYSIIKLLDIKLEMLKFSDVNNFNIY